MKKKTRTINEMIEDRTPMGQRLSGWKGDDKEVAAVVNKKTSFGPASSFGPAEVEKKVKGAKPKFETLIEFANEDKYSKPYILVKKAALSALKKIGAKKMKASASIQAGTIGVTGREPERPDILCNVGNVCIAKFAFGPAGSWKTRFNAAEFFMSELEKLAGREAYVTRIGGNNDGIVLDVTFRIAEKKSKSRKSK